ncbi:hypothetical protein J6590_107761, partial [Homalodisca vitripennis]
VSERDQDVDVWLEPAGQHLPRDVTSLSDWPRSAPLYSLWLRSRDKEIAAAHRLRTVEDLLHDIDRYFVLFG